MTTETKKAVYSLEGSLLEACSCGVLCPCWIGEDPDGGECFAFNAYCFDKGQIGGTDISGLNLVNIVHIPGNVLAPRSWKVAMYVDARANEAQKKALVGVFSGDFGGPLGDLSGLIGEVLAVESAPISHEIRGGAGVISIPGVLEAAMAPFKGPHGEVTTLRDSLFSTVPGSPAYVSKASKNKVNLPQFNMVWEFEGRNAIQSDYKMEYFA
ncbi:MAG TPA: DUF1326 domain-containing protein [Dehalococcoidia bacterium]